MLSGSTQLWFFSSRLLREQEAFRVDKLTAYLLVFQLNTIYDYHVCMYYFIDIHQFNKEYSAVNGGTVF